MIRKCRLFWKPSMPVGPRQVTGPKFYFEYNPLPPVERSQSMHLSTGSRCFVMYEFVSHVTSEHLVPDSSCIVVQSVCLEPCCNLKKRIFYNKAVFCCQHWSQYTVRRCQRSTAVPVGSNTYYTVGAGNLGCEEKTSHILKSTAFQRINFPLLPLEIANPPLQFDQLRKKYYHVALLFQIPNVQVKTFINTQTIVGTTCWECEGLACI